ncbi:hypothetical protein C7B76_06850 [filamentous cyanobacterium CCP2]|nr:hypothetical protein C7B76_06850 [filamentous cyanobacterium CCP2]
MIGGKGNDTYVVDSERDQIIERDGEGYDRVNSYAQRYVLPDFVEELTLMDDAKGIGRNGTGNNQNNMIWGNKWDNELRGEGGNDTIVGMGGKDTIHGGSGNDWLTSSGGGSELYGGIGNDTLIGGVGDTLYGGTGNDTYHIYSNNTPVIVEYANEGTDTIVANIYDSNHPTAKQVYRMSDDLQFVERVELAGWYTTQAVGNRFGNTLVANMQVYEGSHLDGGAGNDTLLGSRFNDTLIGGAGSDQMVGGDGNDHLIGLGGGVDTMFGGAGADFFYLKDFYRTSGYAIIADFNRAQGDKISVQGQASDYVLRLDDLAGVRGSYNDMAIYYKPTNQLVGVVADNINVSLAQDFQYVPGA